MRWVFGCAVAAVLSTALGCIEAEEFAEPHPGPGAARRRPSIERHAPADGWRYW